MAAISAPSCRGASRVATWRRATARRSARAGGSGGVRAGAPPTVSASGRCPGRSRRATRAESSSRGCARCLRIGMTTTRRARRGASSSTSTNAPTSVSARRSRASSLGRLGGTPEAAVPLGVEAKHALLGVRHVAIEIDHTPGRGWFRAGGQVSVRVREPVQRQEPVTCVIPGHDQVRARGRRGPAQCRGRAARVRADAASAATRRPSTIRQRPSSSLESSGPGMCSGARAMDTARASSSSATPRLAPSPG